MAQALNKPSPQLVLDLINLANGTAFTTPDLTFGIPSAAPGGSPRNTQMVVTSTGTTTMVGSRTILYNRLDLTTLFQQVNKNLVDQPDAFNDTQDVLDVLNTRFALALDAEDVNIVSIDRSGDYPYNVVVQAKTGGLVYTGTVTFQLVEDLNPPVTIVREENIVLGGDYVNGSNVLWLDPTDGEDGGFHRATANDWVYAMRPYVLGEGMVQSATGIYNLDTITNATGEWALDVVLRNKRTAPAFGDHYSAQLSITDFQIGTGNSYVLNLVDDGSNAFHWEDASNVFTQAVQYVSGNGAMLQSRIKMKDIQPHLNNPATNTAGTPLGNWHAVLTLRRLSDQSIVDQKIMTINVEGAAASWPVQTFNTTVGSVFTNGEGLLLLDNTAPDGSFFKSQADFYAGGATGPIVATRVFDDVQGPTNSVETQAGAAVYDASFRNPPEDEFPTQLYFDLVVGRGPGGALLADGVTGEFVLSLVNENDEVVEVGAWDLAESTLDLVYQPRVEYTDLFEVTAQYTAAAKASCQTRFTLSPILEAVLQRPAPTVAYRTDPMHIRTNVRLRKNGDIIAHSDTLTRYYDESQPVQVTVADLFMSSSARKAITPDLVAYTDITSPNAPVTDTQQVLRFGSRGNGEIVTVHDGSDGSSIDVFRSTDGGETWDKVNLPDIRTSSDNAVMFKGCYYIALQDQTIDPALGTNAPAGLYRLRWDSAQMDSMTIERVLDVLPTDLERVQLATDGQVLAVYARRLNVTNDGVDWHEYQSPAPTAPGADINYYRFVAMDVYNGRLHAIAHTRSEQPQDGRRLRYLTADLSNVASVTLADNNTENTLPYPFGGAQWTYQSMALYATANRLVLGTGITMEPDGQYVIGELYTCDPATLAWTRVINNSGIVEGKFTRLTGSVIFHGANNSTSGGTENLLISTDDGASWQPDPGAANSPFKETPTEAASVAIRDGRPAAVPNLTYLPEFTSNILAEPSRTFTYNGSIQGAFVMDDSAVILHGSIQNVNGQTFHNVVKFLPNAAGEGPLVDMTYIPNVAGNVSGALEDNGKLIVAGDFFSVDDNNAYRSLARLNADGTLDTTYGPFDYQGSSGSFAAAGGLYKAGSDKMYVIGQFNSIDGASQLKMARLNIADGTVDTTFTPPWGFNSSVNFVHVLPNGKVLVGGNTTLGKALLLNEDGTRDTTPNFGTGSEIVAVVPDEADATRVWVITAQKTQPGGAWGVLYDIDDWSVIESLSAGTFNSLQGASFMKHYDTPLMAVFGSYDYQTEFNPGMDASYVKFVNLNDNTIVARADAPFWINTSAAKILTINAGLGIHLIYGQFEYLEESAYPRRHRAKRVNAARMQWYVQPV